ncbi:amidase [Bacillaceae bacterium JMAK1]|nr:amidase [Bacillaceae bacterium JMAK1]
MEQEYRLMDGIALSEKLKSREWSAKEVVEASIACAHQQNGELNAIVHERYDKVRAEAEHARRDTRFSGVPLLLKNLSHMLEGEVIDAGSTLLKKRVAQRNSHYVNRLRSAGFLFTGFTNSPELGIKNITEPAIHGPSRNPWNKEYSPGGSSGGAAAAVASGMVPIAAASDGGGSIRIPASWTGLVGLKPTRGRMPVGPGVGRQWQGAAIDFVISRSVRDSAAVLDELQTFQLEAAFQIPLFEGCYLEDAKKPLGKLRIAWSDQSPVGTKVSESAKEAVRQVAYWLEREGHYVENCSPGIDGTNLMENYYVMNSGEMANVLDSLEKATGIAITDEDCELETWMLATAGRQIGANHYAKSINGWDDALMRMVRFHETYDLYLTPSTADHAPKIGELTPSTEDKAQWIDRLNGLNPMQQQSLIYEMFLPSLTYSPFTQLSNITGQPAISLPVYQCKNGLPIGVQAMAQKGNESLLLRLGNALEDSHLWQGGLRDE